MQIGFNPHLTLFFFSILIWPYRPWISIWPYRPWIWHLSPGRPGSERGKVQGFVQPASCPSTTRHPETYGPPMCCCTGKPWCSADRILHHNTRAEGVIQNFPWRAEWNIIPQDIAAELTCMKKTMVPKGSPCAFWGWSCAKRTVYKTKLFYPRALRNLWQRKVFRGWWMKQWNVRSLQNLRLKVRPQHPPGTPPATCLKSCVLRLAKLGSPASNLCFVICDWKELWTWILWICVKLYYRSKNGLKDGADILNCNHQS